MRIHRILLDGCLPIAGLLLASIGCQGPWSGDPTVIAERMQEATNHYGAAYRLETHDASTRLASSSGASAPRVGRSNPVPARSVVSGVGTQPPSRYGSATPPAGPVGASRLQVAGTYDLHLDSGASRFRPADADPERAVNSQSLSLSDRHEEYLYLVSMDDEPPADPEGSQLASDAASQSGRPPPAHERSVEDINNQLNNPGADLAQLNFKLTWNHFQGNIGKPVPVWKRLRQLRPGRPIRNILGLKRSSRGASASSQNSLAMSFQPVFPFKLDDGGTFIVRPTIPVVWQPHFNGRKHGFDEQFGLGDMQIVGFYSRTDLKKGYMWGAGVNMQLPTHSDDSLGVNQFQIGPAGFFGLIGKWGSAGLFPQHFWNIGGSSEGYTARTVVQPWYWFNVGKGFQVGGSPAIEYNWAADDSDEAWTVPVNLGVAKTIKFGNTPVKIKFEGIYYIEQPDSFGPHYGFQLTITPVIANPFESHLAKTSA